jgi:glycosyltransferase involved in cell wall biosynthesis
VKILFLNTSKNGGAANAAKRIANTLSYFDHEVSFLTQNDFLDRGKTKLITSGLTRTKILFVKIICRLLQFFFKESYVSTMLIGTISIDQINNSDFDIIHLNWVNSGFVSINQIKMINKPMVWTIHDMWITTGLRHVMLENTKLNIIERVLLSRNRKILNNLRNLHLVSPSKWLGEKIKNRYDLPLSIISNPVSVDASVCSVLKKEKSQILFLHTSKEFHKGYDLLELALEEVALTYDIELVTLLKNIKKNINFAVKEIDYITDENKVLDLISSVKMVVVPSRIDNYPNICLESLKCKVPVVAFSIGGIPEIISHNKTGYLARPFDVSDFANGIKMILDSKIKLEFPENFDNSMEIGKMYNNIYEKIIKY